MWSGGSDQMHQLHHHQLLIRLIKASHFILSRRLQAVQSLAIKEPHQVLRNSLYQALLYICYENATLIQLLIVLHNVMSIIMLSSKWKDIVEEYCKMYTLQKYIICNFFIYHYFLENISSDGYCNKTTIHVKKNFWCTGEAVLILLSSKVNISTHFHLKFSVFVFMFILNLSYGVTIVCLIYKCYASRLDSVVLPLDNSNSRHLACRPQQTSNLSCAIKPSTSQTREDKLYRLQPIM